MRDEDWLPSEQKKIEMREKIVYQAYRRHSEAEFVSARPSAYMKGPDVGSKSKRTQQRYSRLQLFGTSLTGHGAL
jgi:hypothetical protein